MFYFCDEFSNEQHSSIMQRAWEIKIEFSMQNDNHGATHAHMWFKLFRLLPTWFHSLLFQLLRGEIHYFSSHTTTNEQFLLYWDFFILFFKMNIVCESAFLRLYSRDEMSDGIFKQISRANDETMRMNRDERIRSLFGPFVCPHIIKCAV